MKFYQGCQTASSTTAQTDNRPDDANPIYVTYMTTHSICANIGKNYIYNLSSRWNYNWICLSKRQVCKEEDYKFYELGFAQRSFGTLIK